MRIRDPFRLHTPARLAFSGGRTSGLMLYRVIQAFGGKLPKDVIVTFANTGKEVEESLEFVRDCQVAWDVPIRWVEYCWDEGKGAVAWKGKRSVIPGHNFVEVDFETASRNGEPFEAIIRAKAAYRAEAKNEGPILPNVTDRWCSGEMKHRTMDRFMRWLGYDAYTVAVGLRADEPKRVRDMLAQETQAICYECPLHAAGIEERNVLRFWETQPFDLKLKHDPDLGTYEGNCDLCFLKRMAKLRMLQVVRPEAFDWWADWERATGATFARNKMTYQQMADQRVSLALCQEADDLGVCLCTD